MGKFLYVTILLAGLDPTYRDASDNARRALLETEMMKHEMVVLQNDAEKDLYKWTGLRKEDVVWGAYAYPLVTGKISSKPFKNFKYETKSHWVFRPEVEYTFRDGTSTQMLFLIHEF